ncbi:MAG: class I SAM-dependent methyltransferase [Thermoplasmata archaeon]|nr:class I SAM-dependent methyltransferase [Thermoplasmata archaeon]
MVAAPEAAYSEMAQYYDRAYGSRPYSGEARQLRQWARRYTVGRRWLDVACGTGEHLRWLRQWYTVSGVEPSAAMLRVARRKLPGVRLHQARMESFRLPEQFDVISCLFSAVGYLPHRAALNRTLRNFARHLAPDGVLFVEPWIFPEQFHPRGPHGVYVLRRDLPEGVLIRMNRTVRHGRRTTMDFHHLWGDRDGIRYFVERHVSWMFTRAEFVAAFHSAGFRVRLLRPGLSTRRGLWIARHSEPPGIRRAQGRPSP